MTTIPADVARLVAMEDLVIRLRDDAEFARQRSIECRKIGDDAGWQIASSMCDDIREAIKFLTDPSFATPPPAAGPDREAVETSPLTNSDRLRDARMAAADLIEKLAPFLDWKENWLLSAETMRRGHRGKVEHVFVTEAFLSALEPRGDVRREAFAEAATILKQAIADGYDVPARKVDQCDHSKFGWEDCIACYDDALMKVVDAFDAAAIRAAAGEPRPVTETPEREHGAGDVLSKALILIRDLKMADCGYAAMSMREIARAALPDAPGTEVV